MPLNASQNDRLPQQSMANNDIGRSIVSEDLHLSKVTRIKPIDVYALVQKFQSQAVVTREELV